MPISRATLIAHLESDDEQVRLNAAVRLAYLGHADGIDQLEQGLAHPEAAIRLVQVPDALAMLGDAGLQRARALVIRAGPARLGAARTLAHAGDPTDIGDAISAALLDADLATRDDAACLAGELGPAVIDAYDALAHADAPHALTALVAVGGGRALDTAAQALRAGTARVTALRALAGLGRVARSARHDVLAVLHDSSSTLRDRLTAAHTLTRIDDDGDATARDLLTQLDDAGRWLRIGLIRTLAQLGPRYPRLPERSRMWPEWEERLVVSARPATVATQGKAVVATLIEHLTHDDSDVRRNAAFALALHGRPAPSGAIEPGLRHEVQTLATRAPRVQPEPAAWPWSLHMTMPPVDLDVIAADCESLWATADGGDLDYTIDVPKWQFLHYLVERRGLLLHGSQTPGIDVLEPRSRSWGGGRIAGQPGVFAVDHAPFAMYFAIIDKSRASNTPNAIYNVRRPDRACQRCFLLSINGIDLAHYPFTDATIYVLPPDTFAKLGELTSVVPVRPLGRLAIQPADFPFLHRLWGSDLGPLCHQFGARFPFLRDVGAWPTKTLDGR